MTSAPIEDPCVRNIAVVGGGITGLFAALRLARLPNVKITLFEKHESVGGLSGYYQWQDIIWDRFYHVVLSTDSRMIEFLTELGLASEIFWKDTNSGFFGKGRLVSMSTTLDFIRFPFMTLWQKFRMGLGILYSLRIKNPSRLDKIYVREWLTRVFGRRVYENIWAPLLRSKLGSAREKSSAAFIWATITRLYGTRQGREKKEKMGHVRGGYYTILNQIQKRCQELNITIKTSEHAVSVLGPGDTSINGQLTLATEKSTYSFDKILLTIDSPSVLKVVKPTDDHPYWNNLAKTSYLGIVCLFIVLKRELSKYYVINLLDETLPFTGIIETTNVVSPDHFKGRHLVYLPKYSPIDDPIFSLTDQEIQTEFMLSLKRVYPDLEDSDILHIAVFRERCVQPLHELNALDRQSGFATPIQGLYVANTSMISNSTLNNNAAISIAQGACAVLEASL